MYYHGTRYYIPWIAKWTAIDPIEAKYAGMSPYNYAFNNPVMWNDLDGADPKKKKGRQYNRESLKGPTTGFMESRNTDGTLSGIPVNYLLNEVDVLERLAAGQKRKLF